MRVVASGLQFPEGPVALEDGSVLVVEIARETLSRVATNGRIEVVATLPGGPNGAALAPDGRVYVCNNGGMTFIETSSGTRPGIQSASYRNGGIDLVELSSGRVKRLYDRCGDRMLRGPNDVVLDRNGGLWFTDMGKRRECDLDLGCIYWARTDGSEIKLAAEGLITPNGIGLSADEKILYVTETATGRLWSWQIIGPGELRKAAWPALAGANLVAGPGGSLRFDGFALTTSGAFCIAALDRAAVVEISPSGRMTRQREVPDLMVTNICFGGADMQTAYVTLSHTGRLVALDWHEPGQRLVHQY
jgi:gluconolactonase